MESEARILLDDTVAFCRRDGRDARLINMLGQSSPIGFNGDALTIEAPSRFAVSFLEKSRGDIEAYLEEIAFCPIALKVTAPGGPGAAGTATAPAAAPAAPMDPVAAPAQQPAPEPAPSFAAAPVQPIRPGTLPVAGNGPSEGVRINNTLSREDFLRLTGRAAEVEQPAPATQPLSAPIAAQAQPDAAHSAANSKFTFANFVYGDENKHAYHSAQRFAAFADEPGQYNSLFIYGRSGLGKTHLLLAIKNYLAEKKPHIRVKYANSQDYIDDFISGIGRQQDRGNTILRDYHEANVLIIDDIQNIIGKQASIEYFFSLMDEFIRENKKIVIASDRAPKKLGMDERLTSRFNAGMLCLVSEPGFEMKYAILKRYYDTCIKGASDVSGMNIDASLLSAFQSNDGKLTDEQLRHMAEISSNNIRELESFCERCASLSFEREQSGQELTAQDIEHIADEYFDTAHKIIHIDTVQACVEEFYHVTHEELIGPKRSKDIAFARHVAVYLSNSLCGMSSGAIGAEFGGRDHSTVLNSLKVVESKMKEDRRICEDLQQLKNKITLRS